ncbi:MAG: DUF3108 domain-containing protein, partial [Bacteroidetes bacterium]|nr:DUF3108 domain-containing protein [Bacteroidota bacterium]
MKNWIYIIASAVLVITLTSSNMVSYPTASNKAFAVGEKLRYRVTYGFVDAGEATLEVKSTSKKGNGRELLQVTGLGRTLGGFNAFFKVNDVY